MAMLERNAYIVHEVLPVSLGIQTLIDPGVSILHLHFAGSTKAWHKLVESKEHRLKNRMEVR